ncbi:extracellular solute-binding protein [Burkholderia multivorans]|uniref:Extracellular solute-binding protein n=1 Tax=Burkholderia multivorans TaxID=87883 RepID=A0A8E2S117_9BURK|nr:extracellular solute-binding protein [Burkholderia multivorans]KVS10749.1 spermidine/putrescine ABC transporter substrate-binding protein [Burkholderia multivorans]MBU9250089.1 extracellular solute-binding protein [Burkholderia multivorans]MBU9253381.1 extracellular solute-binding protein [Burkholderia multivorans]MBU9355645.1 extracellular solute-binding protein [Burkholderia multivorans]MBU9361037.1 extracellular solute-binding protein [Burkholderia multivorans]
MQPSDSSGDPLISRIGVRSPERGAARRMFVKLALGLLCPPIVAFSAEAANRNVLRVLAWPGYADRDAVAAFEAQFGARVEVTFVDSDEALWARMHSASPPPYDVLAANTAEIQRYARGKLLAPIDLSRIPNRRRQLPAFQQLAAIGGLAQGDAVYGIPFTYSSMGVIYDRRQVPAAPRSMLALWDRRYRGKVLDFNSAQHNFSFTALALGYRDPFRLTPAQTLVVARKLVDLRRNLLTYYTLPEEATALFVEHRAALMFGNYGTQQVQLLRRAGADVGYAIPDEGALAWLDCWAVTRGADRPDLAFAWINYMLEPAIGALLTERQGLANTLAPPLGADVAGQHLVWIQPVENIARREALWSRIVSGDRPEHFRP